MGEIAALEAARAALAAEWEAAGPADPAAIARFYREAEGLGADLDAWHQTPERQVWTTVAVGVAQQIKAHVIVDVGCGAGHDLRALDAALPDEVELYGVEPNDRLRALVNEHVPCVPDVSAAPLDVADLVLCLDVLEHLPDPATFLAEIASLARLGCVLIEATATHDTGTPLHLASNRGWHPGHTLERLGWELLDSQGRLRVWQRTAVAGPRRAAALVCAYRAISVPTVKGLLELQAAGMRVQIKNGDALISRSRGIIASRWWAETADDVFLMIDDDIVFSASDAERLVSLCRDGYDLVGAAYPVRDGAHLALRALPGRDELAFGPGMAPEEVRYLSTGFLAVHRRVLDALIPTLPLCHGNEPWAYWPLFSTFTVPDPAAGGVSELSEDWAFCERARQAGFHCWLDPTIRLGHLAQVELSIDNMSAIHAALTGVATEDGCHA